MKMETKSGGEKKTTEKYYLSALGLLHLQIPGKGEEAVK